MIILFIAFVGLKDVVKFSVNKTAGKRADHYEYRYDTHNENRDFLYYGYMRLSAYKIVIIKRQCKIEF
jgi:hypothetical protein